MEKAAVIILNWNKKDLTHETAESLKVSDLTGFKMEIVIVDNGSTDGSQAFFKDYVKNERKKQVENLSWKVIENLENWGFAKGNNVGMQYALDNGFDYIFLLNDDTLVERSCIKNLVNFAQKRKGLGAVAPKIYFAPGYEFHKSRYRKKDVGKVIWYAGGDIDWDNVYGTNHGVDEVDCGQFEKIVDTDFATGCCVLYTKEALTTVGLFDERYYLYLEDADMSQRLKRHGFKVLYYPGATLWHKVAQSSGIGSDLNDYFITRNRMLFGMSFAKLRTKFALIRESLRFLFSGRKWQKTAIRDYYLGNFGKGSWGKK